MKLKELFFILCLFKRSTLRKYKKGFKGCHKIGNEYLIKKGMFDKEYCFKIRITNRYFVNINALSDKDFNELGYKNKENYLKMDYNLANPSDLRIRYDFEVIEINEKRLIDLGVI